MHKTRTAVLQRQSAMPTSSFFPGSKSLRSRTSVATPLRVTTQAQNYASHSNPSDNNNKEVQSIESSRRSGSRTRSLRHNYDPVDYWFGGNWPFGGRGLANTTRGIFDDLLDLNHALLHGQAPLNRRGAASMKSALWSPSIDVHESDKELTIIAEVPGVDKQDLKIDIRDNTLILKGEKKHESTRRLKLPATSNAERKESDESLVAKDASAEVDKEADNADEGSYTWVESSHGSFQRTIELPENISTRDAKATYENGVLKIVLRKSLPPQSHSLSIE